MASHSDLFRDLIGIPFVDKGRDRGTGLDCWGLMMVAMGRIGMDLPDFDIGCFCGEVIGSMVDEQKRSGKWKRIEEPDTGDLVLMELDPEKPGTIQHFGMFLKVGEKKMVLHTLVKVGSCLSPLDDRYWQKKVRGYYRWTNS